MRTERWLPVLGLEGSYEVSDLGRVKSLARTVTRSDGLVVSVQERILRHGTVTGGYELVVMRAPGKAYTRLVHRIVLEAFVGIRPEGMECCHADGDPTNNRLENLRWGTSAENSADMVSHGTTTRGESQWKAKLTEADILEVVLPGIAQGRTQTSIADELGVNQGTISVIAAGRSWSWLTGIKETPK